MYPDAATTFAGLTTVIAPAASQPLVFDQSRLWLCINRDFVAEFSDQVSEAWNRYATSLRIVGRFALACPKPAKAIRRLSVTGAESRTAKAETSHCRA